MKLDVSYWCVYETRCTNRPTAANVHSLINSINQYIYNKTTDRLQRLEIWMASPSEHKVCLD